MNKDLMFETEIYNKGNVYKLISMPYFKINAPQVFNFEINTELVEIALKDKNKGLKMSDYNRLLDILTDNEIFYNTIRDIFLELKGVLK